GIEILKRMPDIDVVLVDIMMPVMDGYATIRSMRKLPDRGVLPIVALTAKATAGTRPRCLDAGATAYVSKPFEPADLLVVLSEWLPGAAPAARRAGGPD